MTSLAKWDAIYSQKPILPTACLALEQNQHLLPKSGDALDLACGQGGNALLLAEHGLTVSAWDQSAVAVEQLRQNAESRSLVITTQARDVVDQPPEPDSLDVLVISYFLDRALCPLLVKALRPNGVLFYQTYCQQKVQELGPKNPDYLLQENELLRLFSDLKVRVYREEALLGDAQQGWRNQAMLVAER